ncbi:MAG: DUF1616 domain-containing protein [Nitrososphaera sp.]|nr:DUF1616 domain-containing protein [Nitrososphaera sp.]
MESNPDTNQLAESERSELIERMVMDVMHRQNCRKVRDVVANLQRLDRSIGTDEIHGAIRRLERKGSMNLSEEKVSASFTRNLLNIEANGPFWLVILASAAILVAVYVLPQEDAWRLPRNIAGAIFLFFIPGHAVTYVFVPKNRLSPIERIAVSIGLSLATIVIIGIMLSYGPLGVDVDAIVASVAAFTTVSAILATHRDFERRHRAILKHNRFTSARS